MIKRKMCIWSDNIMIQNNLTGSNRTPALIWVDTSRI